MQENWYMTKYTSQSHLRHLSNCNILM